VEFVSATPGSGFNCTALTATSQPGSLRHGAARRVCNQVWLAPGCGPPAEQRARPATCEYIYYYLHVMREAAGERQNWAKILTEPAPRAMVENQEA